MAKVTFYSKTGYTGKSHTFDKPGTIDDLSEHKFDGSGDMDKDIESLKVGQNTWVVVFSDKMLGLEAMKLGPGKEIKSLKEYDRTSQYTWNNDIRSLVIYDHEPIFWNTENHVTESACWLKLYQGKRFSEYGWKLDNRIAPSSGTDVYEDTPSLYCLYDYFSWHKRDALSVYNVYRYPNSLATGPGAWVELFNNHHFTGAPICQFGPNSVIKDLSDYTTEDINGIRVHNSPQNFTGESAAIPGDLIAIQKYQTSQSLCNAITGAIGLASDVASIIPVVGDIAAVGGDLLTIMVNVLWPDNSPSKNEIWNDMALAATGKMQDLINANNLKELNGKISDLHDLLKKYMDEKAGGAKKMTYLNDVQNKLTEITNRLMPQEADGSLINPSENLPYLLSTGSVAIALQVQVAYSYETISGGVPHEDPTGAIVALDDLIDNLYEAVENALRGTLKWRLGQITHGPISDNKSNYFVEDTYAGYRQTFTNQQESENDYDARVRDVRQSYPPFLLGTVAQANLWPCFKSTNIEPADGNNDGGRFNIKLKEKPEAVPVVVSFSTDPSQAPGNLGLDITPDHPISGITIYADTPNAYNGCLRGIKFNRTGLPDYVLGAANGSSVNCNFGPNEGIVAAYGGHGSYVDQIIYRTNIGRDLGNGGGGGGTFYWVPPQGVGAVLTKVTASPAYQDHLTNLTHEWTYLNYSFQGKMLTLD